MNAPMLQVDNRLPTALAAAGGRGPRHGCGDLHCAVVAGQSTAVGVSAREPLKLLVPRHRGDSVWAFAATYGGGLLAGDRIELGLRIDAGAVALLGTQASTKVYRSAGAESRQELRATVAEDGVLAVLPDPVTCFADARYVQDQRFDLAPGASLLLLDWLTSGRAARDERWAFATFRSRNRISVAGRTLLNDALQLRGDAGSLPGRMGRFQTIATAVLVGPRFALATRAILDELAAAPVVAGQPLLASASPLADGCVLRIAGVASEIVGRFLRHRLAPLCAVLGDDPWARKG